MERRLGVVSVLVKKMEHVPRLNETLSSFGDIILGRMGLPIREKKIHLISLIVDGNTDEIGALTGKLGNIPGVEVKSMLTNFSNPAHE